MTRIIFTLAALFSFAVPLSAQTVTVPLARLDSLKAQITRSRTTFNAANTTYNSARTAFNSAGVTLNGAATAYSAAVTRYLALLDSIRTGGTPPSPPPPPDTTPTPPPPPGGQLTPAWFSDDRTTAVGTTGSRDGTKWAAITGLLNGTIIDAPAGLPMARLRRIAGGPDRDGAHIMTAQSISEMAVNSTRNWRWYYTAQMPCTGAGQGQHPIQDGGAVSQSNWYFGTTHCVNGLEPNEWGLQFNFSGNPSPNFRWFLGSINASNNVVFTALAKSTVTYRVEIQLARISTTQFRAHLWISNGATEVLLFDDGDFTNENGTQNLAARPLINFNVVSNTGVLVAGLNGIANNTVWPIHHNDQGAFAIVDGVPEGSQIGAYGRVVGEVPR